ncbi:hypothetical protein ACRRTK_001437 [Alexandromys fortis]
MGGDVENHLCLLFLWFSECFVVTGFCFSDKVVRLGKRDPWALNMDSQLLRMCWQRQVLIRVGGKTSHLCCLICRLI